MNNIVSCTLYQPASGEILGTHATDAEMVANYVRQGCAVIGLYDAATHYIRSGQPTEYTAEQREQKQNRPGDGYVWSNQSLSWEFIPSETSAWQQVRAKRAQLLAESDWTQLPDVVLDNKAAWAEYRQALRDVTLQPDPYNISWPTHP